MICSDGGQVHTTTRTLETRKALLGWLPMATDQALPAIVTISTCRACGRLDKHLERPCNDEQAQEIRANSFNPNGIERYPLLMTNQE